MLLETDVLDKAIKGCISQIGEDKILHLIAYYSKKLLLAKLNYNVYNKELLAIVDTIEH
jgi:RNase H-like domain found in reverse transcriptase